MSLMPATGKGTGGRSKRTATIWPADSGGISGSGASPGMTDHRPLEVAGSGRVAHHGQQRNPAAGFPGLLGQQVQDPQGSLDGPAAGGRGGSEVEKFPRQAAGDRA